jgi:hypothetical protein
LGFALASRSGIAMRQSDRANLPEHVHARNLGWLVCLCVLAGVTNCHEPQARVPASSQTASPPPTERDDTAYSERESSFYAECGAHDEALARIAHELASVRSRTGAPPTPDAAAKWMRALGVPYVQPTLFVALGDAPVDAAIRASLERRRDEASPTRCGVALVPMGEPKELVVIVRVQAWASMEPLAIRARTGAWITFSSALHEDARTVSLFVAGPHGAPQTVPVVLSAGQAHARFALGEPGAFVVQLVGDVGHGPQPLLEAHVFADVEPDLSGDEPVAPGEEAGGEGDDASALFRMVKTTRQREGLRVLKREHALDVLAHAHALRMKDRHSVAHDVGDGDLRARFEAASPMKASSIGENVAKAPTLALAHRTLYASPSHRANLLGARYTHIGLAVERDDDGGTVVCEVFAGNP